MLNNNIDQSRFVAVAKRGVAHAVAATKAAGLVPATSQSIAKFDPSMSVHDVLTQADKTFTGKRASEHDSNR